MMDEKSLSASMARSQKLAFADNMFLPDKFLQRARPRMRAASGASGFMRSCMAWSKRSVIE
jgi:hypothetical protein